MDPSTEPDKIKTPKVISEEQPSWWERHKAAKQRQYDRYRKARIKRDAIRDAGRDIGPASRGR